MTTRELVEKFCNGLTEEGLAKWVEHAIENHPTLDANGKSFARTLDPKKSPLVRTMIYDAYQKQMNPPLFKQPGYTNRL